MVQLVTRVRYVSCLGVTHVSQADVLIAIWTETSVLHVCDYIVWLAQNDNGIMLNKRIYRVDPKEDSNNRNVHKYI